jgi:hypothetical protein
MNESQRLLVKNVDKLLSRQRKEEPFLHVKREEWHRPEKNNDCNVKNVGKLPQRLKENKDKVFHRQLSEGRLLLPKENKDK